MLSKQELYDLAKIKGLKPHQLEKNYIQTIILNSLYQKISNELVFKGGTCLFFLYGLPRFSEDLDFTLNGDINIKDLTKDVGKTLGLMAIRHRIEQVKETESSIAFRVGAEGPLFTKEIERCFVNVEISKREKVFGFHAKEIKSAYPDALSFVIPVMKEEEILAEKIRAIMTRNQARDVYDLWFLLERGIKINFGMVNDKLNFYNMKFTKKEFLNEIQEKEGIWKPELEPFVFSKLPDFSKVFKKIKAFIKENEK